MNKKNVRLAAFTGIAVLALGTIHHAFTQTGDQEGSQSRQVIRLVERLVDVAFQDAAPAGPSLGDRIVFTSDLFDERGRLVGRDGADCVTVRLDRAAPPALQQVVQCTVTVQLPDGQITFQALGQGAGNYFAVTGGTGAYRAARGEAFVRDRVPLQVADVTITLIR
ncbi:MAG: allene oxide cyclase barrel-like domain-containing protein [Bryobacteraceae bacterium]